MDLFSRTKGSDVRRKLIFRTNDWAVCGYGEQRSLPSADDGNR
jgi:hypothetical protein